eukprot:m.253434 g.253434  ORF g.253434 m.253434 type:complete len:2134 (+) comp17538_c0_seq1:183-6584(+)
MMSAAADQASKTASKTKKVSRNGQRHSTHSSHSSSSTVMTVPIIDESQMVELERQSSALAIKLDRLNSDMSLPGDESEDLNRSITECQSFMDQHPPSDFEQDKIRALEQELERSLEEIRMHETFKQEYTEKQVTWQWTVDNVMYGVEGIEELLERLLLERDTALVENTRLQSEIEARDIKLQRFQEALTRAEMLTQEQVARNEKLTLRNHDLEAERDTAVAGQRQAEVQLKQAQGDLARALERLEMEKESRHADNVAWQERWDALEADLKSLRGELRETRVQCQDALHQKDALHSELVAERDISTELRRELELLKKSKEGLTARIRTLQAQLDELNGEVASITSKYEVSMRKQHELQQQLSVLQEQHDALLATLRNEHATAIAESSKQHEAALRMLQDEHARQTEPLRRKLRESESVVTGLERQLAELQAMHASLRVELSEHSAREEQLATANQRLEHNLHTWQQQTEGLESERAKREAYHHTSLTTLHEQMSKESSNIQHHLQQSQEQYEESLRTLNAQLLSYQQDVRRLEDEKHQGALERAALQRQLDDALAITTKLTTDVNHLKGELTESHDEVQELRRQLQAAASAKLAAEQAADLARQEQAKLEQALEQERAAFAQLKSRMESSLAAMREQEERREKSHREEIGNMEDRLSQAHMTIEELQQRLQEALASEHQLKLALARVATLEQAMSEQSAQHDIDLNALRQSHQHSMDALSSTVLELRETIEQLRSELQKAEANAEQARRELASVSLSMESLRVERQELNSVVESMRAKHGQALDMLRREYESSTVDLETRVKEVETRTERSTVSISERSLTEHKEHITHLTKDVESARAGERSALKKVLVVEKRCQELETELKSSMDQLRLADDADERHREERDRLRADRQSLISTQEEEVRVLKTELQDYTRHVSERDEELNQVKQAHYQLELRLANVVKSEKSLKTQVAELETQLQPLEGLRMKVEKLNASVTSLHTSETALKEELLKSQAAYKTERARAVGLETTNAELDSSLQQLQAHIVSLREKNEQAMLRMQEHHKSEISAANQRYESVRQQLNQAQSDLQTAQATASEATQALSTVTHELDSANVKVKALQKRIKQLEALLEQVEKERKEEMAHLKQEQAATRELLQMQMEQVREKSTVVVERGGNDDVLKAEIESLKEQIFQLQFRVRSLTETNEELQGDYTALQAKLSSAQADRDAARALVAELEQDVTTARGQLDRLKQETSHVISSLKHELNEEVKNNASLEGRVKELLQLEGDLTAQLQAAKESQAKLREEVARLEAEARELVTVKARLTSALSELETAQATEKALRGELNEARLERIQLQAAAEQAEAKLESATLRMVELEQRLRENTERFSAAIEQLKNEHDLAIKANLEQFEQLRKAQQQALSHMRQEYEAQMTTVKKSLADLQSQLKTAHSTISTLQAEIKTLHSQLGEKQSEVAHLEESLAKLTSTLDRSRSQILKLESKNADYLQQIESLKSELTSLQSKLTLISSLTVERDDALAEVSRMKTEVTQLRAVIEQQNKASSIHDEAAQRTREHSAQQFAMLRSEMETRITKYQEQLTQVQNMEREHSQRSVSISTESHQQIESLKAQSAKDGETILDLQTRLAGESTARSQLDEERKSLISRIDQLTKELSQERSGAHRYRDANANEISKLREQLKLMSSSLHEAQSLAEQVPVLQSQLEQIKSSFSSTIASMKQSHAEELQRVRESQRQRLAELEAMLHEKDVSLAKLNADIAALKNSHAVELQEVQRDRAELQVSRDGLRAEVTELKRRLEQALADVAQAKQALKVAQEEVANQTSKATILSNEVKAQHDLVGKLRARIKQLEASMTKAEQEFKVEMAHMKDVNTEQAHRLSIVETEANAARRALMQSQQDAEALSATLVEYESNLTELKQCFELSQGALKAAHEALTALDNESHARVSAAQSALVAQLEASRELSEGQARMADDLAACQAELKKKDGLLAEKLKQLAALESAEAVQASKVNLNLTFESQSGPISEAIVEDYKKTIADLNADIDVHTKATAAAEAQLLQSRQQLATLSSKLQEAQRELNKNKVALMEATSAGMIDRAKAKSLQQQVDYQESRVKAIIKEHDVEMERLRSVWTQRLERAERVNNRV